MGWEISTGTLGTFQPELTLSEITLVDVMLPTRSGTAIRKRCISQPTEHQQILLQRLGLQLPTALERAAM